MLGLLTQEQVLLLEYPLHERVDQQVVLGVREENLQGVRVGVGRELDELAQAEDGQVHRLGLDGLLEGLSDAQVVVDGRHRDPPDVQVARGQRGPVGVRPVAGEVQGPLGQPLEVAPVYAAPAT